MVWIPPIRYDWITMGDGYVNNSGTITNGQELRPTGVKCCEVP